MDAATMAGFVELLKTLGEWGVGPLVLLGPTALCFTALWLAARCFRSLEKTMIEGLAEVRLVVQDMTRKYENNAHLADETQRLARNAQAQNDTLIQVLRENTAALTMLSERLAGMRNQ